MTTATIRHSDFSLGQCRDALANLDKDVVEQAVFVMTSQNTDLIENASNNPDLGRAIFWVREWTKVERIQSRGEAVQRLKLIHAIRARRQNQFRQLSMWVSAGACGVALVAFSMHSLIA